MGLDTEYGLGTGRGLTPELLPCEVPHHQQGHPNDCTSSPLSQQTTHPPWMRARTEAMGGTEAWKQEGRGSWQIFLC